MPIEKIIANLGIFILVLFLFPVCYQYGPGWTNAKAPKLMKETSYMVYAANIIEEECLRKLAREQRFFISRIQMKPINR